MRSAWLVGLLVFSLAASGFILVQGRDDADPAAFGAALAEEAREGVQDVASDLGLPAEASEPPQSSGTFYRYTDASGTMRFVGSLDEVPPAFRANAREVARDRVQRAPANEAAPPARAQRKPRAVAALEPAPDLPAAEHEVVIYTTSWCGWCRKAVKFLTQRGVAFENRDIEANREWRRELKQKTGSTSVPMVEIDGEIIRGYDPERMAALLEAS